MPRIPDILRRWDRIAYAQLCEAAARLADENETLRTELGNAYSDAESWRDDALRLQDELCDATGSAPGITQSGQLVTMPN